MSSFKLDYTLEELQTLRHHFATGLSRSGDEQSSSFAWLNHRLPSVSLVKPGEQFQAIVIGGTNLHSALVSEQNGHITIHDKLSTKLPTLKNTQALLSTISQAFRPDCSVLAVNFTYPVRPSNSETTLDGVLITGTKEHQLEGVVGQPVGQLLATHLSDQLHKQVTVTLANDTLCLGLAGLESAPLEQLVSLIVGTGTNSGFFSDPTEFINLESGNFKGLPPTDTGKLIDQVSANPGQQLFEKEVAGAYLYKHFNFIAGHKGIDRQLTSTQELNQFAATGNPKEQALARTIVAKSASLVAAVVAAFHDYKRLPHITFATEGGVFWQGYHYQTTLTQYLSQLGLDTDSISFIKVEDSGLVGAARLALYPQL